MLRLRARVGFTVHTHTSGHTCATRTPILYARECTRAFLMYPFAWMLTLANKFVYTRSNHAGETGAVHIYRGAQWALDFRKNVIGIVDNDYIKDLRSFISDHQQSEQKHLNLFDQILEAEGGEKSIFLPGWRLSGFALGAISAIWCPRGMYVTTDAVESFVEEHYKCQLSCLEEEISRSRDANDLAGATAREELLFLIRYCCEDEIHHKEEARLRVAAGALPWFDWVDTLWRWLVFRGSAAAAGLAKKR